MQGYSCRAVAKAVAATDQEEATVLSALATALEAARVGGQAGEWV